MSPHYDARKSEAGPSQLQPVNASIASFLTALGQDLHLCSIVPDGYCAGRWFGNDVPAATEWAATESLAGRNVCWTTNQVAEDCNKKPSKADFVGARFAHIDIDPPKDGRPIDKLRTQAELVALPIPPTLIIDSGGGLQAFWRLSGRASLAEVESVNRSVDPADRGLDHRVGRVQVPDEDGLADPGFYPRPWVSDRPRVRNA